MEVKMRILGFFLLIMMLGFSYAIAESNESKLKEFRKRYKRIKDSRDPEKFFELANWARKNKLYTQAYKLFHKILELDPDHKSTRRLLGFRYFRGKWLKEREIMAAKGLIRYKGIWLTEAEKELEDLKDLKKKIKRFKRKIEALKKVRLKVRKKVCLKKILKRPIYQFELLYSFYYYPYYYYPYYWPYQYWSQRRIGTR
jgi:tetratricopeptide (TPR) repeat protein